MLFVKRGESNRPAAKPEENKAAASCGKRKPEVYSVIIKYPFPVLPPFVPTENPVGLYRRTFAVPPE